MGRAIVPRFILHALGVRHVFPYVSGAFLKNELKRGDLMDDEKELMEDRLLFKKAMEDYQRNPKTYTLDEVEREIENKE